MTTNSVLSPVRTTVYIGVGANLGDRMQQLNQAITAIAALTDTHFRCRSPIYQTTAIGPVQPDYLNAVIEIETLLAPDVLLQHLLDIECRLGRVRDVRWGARMIDLDVLLYGDQSICSPTLTIPHPHLHERAFVLYPLADIAPQLLIPRHGTISDLLQHVPRSGIQVYSNACFTI